VSDQEHDDPSGELRLRAEVLCGACRRLEADEVGRLGVSRVLPAEAGRRIEVIERIISGGQT
jgi:hypothetical protein